MRAKAKQSATDPLLNKLRLVSNLPVLQHALTVIMKTVSNKTGLLNCALCSRGKLARQVRSYCVVCKVALCNKKYDGFDTSCFDAWHSVDNLEEGGGVTKMLLCNCARTEEQNEDRCR